MNWIQEIAFKTFFSWLQGTVKNPKSQASAKLKSPLFELFLALEKAFAKWGWREEYENWKAGEL